MPRQARLPALDGNPPVPAPAGGENRFEIRWGAPGLCPGRDELGLLVRRQALFAGFTLAEVGDLQIRHAPEISAAAIHQAARALARARTIAAELLDTSPDAAAPPVTLYRSDEQMRGVACVNESAIGYYDGTIHVSVDPGHTPKHVAETVIHEYLHHALHRLGVRSPMWLHEGLAMYAAGERWFDDPRLRLRRWLQGDHLPFAAMVSAFPHTADPPFAVASYYQSFMMVDFLRQRRGPDAFRQLARDLAAGTIRPDEAFARGAGVTPAEIEASWRLFLGAPR